MITKDQIYTNNETGRRVLVLRVSGFRLTYQDSGSLKVVSQTEFLEQFTLEPKIESGSASIDAQEMKLMDWVDLKEPKP